MTLVVGVRRNLELPLEFWLAAVARVCIRGTCARAYFRVFVQELLQDVTSVSACGLC